MADYDRLTALDASFLYLEDTSSHMHVGAVLVFDANGLRTPEGGIDVERIRASIGARLHQVPRFRQRIAWIPVEGTPVWIDDDRFRLAYHVRHTALPRPGDERTLKRLAARIMSQPLDRKRPLWEMWVVEGLADDRFALISKTHHCMIDGVSGSDMISIILSRFADAAIPEAPPWTPRPAPSGVRLVLDDVVRRATEPAAAAFRGALDAVRNPVATARTVADVATGVVETIAPTLTSASPTPLNVPAGPHRRFDWTDMRIGAIKAVGGALGGTLNDVVLATVAGALRRFFVRRAVQPDGLEVRAMVPVSLRTKDQHDAQGNRVSALTVALPVAFRDPVERLNAVVRVTKHMKESKAAYGGEVLGAVAEWMAPNLLHEAARLAMRQRPYNLVVTNVPGPPTPLYLLGAPMRASYPVVPLFETLALGIALFSYDGGLYWGFNADWEAFPDLHDLVLDVEESFRELQGAAGRAEAERG